MARKHSTDPALRELEQELDRTTQALKEAYIRFDYVCDGERIDACIFEVNALKARSNYLLRRIKEHSGIPVPSGIPRAVPVPPAQDAEDGVAAGTMKGGEICQV